MRLSLADGSVTEFSGHEGDHFCYGKALTLNDEGTVLYVGYHDAECVVAYDVATLQLMWSVDVEARVRSIAYHDGLVLVAADDAPLFELSAGDGSVVRRLARVEGCAYNISVFAGLCRWWFVATLGGD